MTYSLSLFSESATYPVVTCCLTLALPTTPSTNLEWSVFSSVPLQIPESLGNLPKSEADQLVRAGQRQKTCICLQIFRLDWVQLPMRECSEHGSTESLSLK